MHLLYVITNYLLVTAMLALVFGVPVIIIRAWNTRSAKTTKAGRPAPKAK